MALQQLPDVIDAFVDSSIIVHLKAPGALSPEAVQKVLAKHEVQLKSLWNESKHLLSDP